MNRLPRTNSKNVHAHPAGGPPVLRLHGVFDQRNTLNNNNINRNDVLTRADILDEALRIASSTSRMLLLSSRLSEYDGSESSLAACCDDDDGGGDEGEGPSTACANASTSTRIDAKDIREEHDATGGKLP